MKKSRIIDPAPEETSPFQVVDGPNGAAAPSAPERPLFVDLGELVRQGLPRERPSVAQAFGDRCLLYKGRLNEVHAEPGAGKTNVACAMVALVVQAGGVALFLDPEDTPQGIAAKLASFGLTAEQLSAQVRYVHNPEPLQYLQAQNWAAANPCDLVVCDGLAEAMAAEGLNEDVPGEVLKFFRNRLRPFSDSGAAVLVSDHVSKNAETRGRWQRGSGAKMGRYDGVSYSLALGEAYRPARPENGDPGKCGFVRLVVAKDRLGGVGVLHQAVAHLHLSPDGENTVLQWREPTAGSDFLPTAIMAKVSNYLQANPNAGKRELRGLGGKAAYVDLAIVQLVKLGYLRETDGGAGKATKYDVLKPYSEEGK